MIILDFPHVYSTQESAFCLLDSGHLALSAEVWLVFNTYACVLFSFSAFSAQSAEQGQHFSPREPHNLLITPPRPFSTFFFFFCFFTLQNKPIITRETRIREMEAFKASSRDVRQVAVRRLSLVEPSSSFEFIKMSQLSLRLMLKRQTTT